jgi:hypothetical protein
MGVPEGAPKTLAGCARGSTTATATTRTTVRIPAEAEIPTDPLPKKVLPAGGQWY